MRRVLFTMLAALMLVTMAQAAGDSLLLYNPNYSTTGIWMIGLNNQGMLDGAGSTATYLPESPFSGGILSFWDDAGSYGPYLGLEGDPNFPIVGDADGDGVVDPVLVGQKMDGGANRDGAIAAWSDRPEGSNAFHATLVDDIHKIVAVGDVSGDGIGDLITRSTSNDMWVAYHSDPCGFQNGPDSWGGGAGDFANPMFTGDFNGDGLTDVGEVNETTRLALCYLSTVYDPCDPCDPTGHSGGIANGNDNTGSYFWHNIKPALTDPVTYLSGDVNGDGMDDLVEAFQQSGVFLCRIYIASTGAATPAGMSFGGAYSWANVSRNVLATTKNVTPMLADINDDGFADFVIYDEFTHTNNNTYGRVKVVYGDGNVQHVTAYAAWNNAPNYEFTYFNYYGIFGQDVEGFLPFVGNRTADCDIPGDLNGDCVVNMDDFVDLSVDWLTDNN